MRARRARLRAQIFRTRRCRTLDGIYFAFSPTWLTLNWEVHRPSQLRLKIQNDHYWYCRVTFGARYYEG